MIRDLLHWQAVAVFALTGGLLLSGDMRQSAAQDQPGLAPLDSQAAPNLKPIPLNDPTADEAEEYVEYPGGPDLFYNYYTSPGASRVPAKLYQAPIPVPQNVGHVYYSYPPFLPHEHLYTHYRQYWNYYGHYHGYGGCQGHASVNKTTVRYQRGSIRPTVFYRLRSPMVPCNPCR